MNITRVLIVLLTFINVNINAQVLEIHCAETLQPVANACVKLSNVVSGRKSVFITDNLGKIYLNLKDSSQFNHVITVHQFGYQKYHDTLKGIENQRIYIQPSVFSTPEVIVTAQYAPQNAQNAVQKVRVIDNEKITAMGAQNLADVLSNELNIRLSQDNVLGSSMNMQGLGGQNVKILIDGVPMIGRNNGNIDLSQINMLDVEKIEIVEGPLSVNYGTDALGGTINIITKKNTTKSFNITASTYYESIGQYNNTISGGFKKGKISVGVSAGRNFFDGWRDTDNSFHVERKINADSTRYMSWKPKEQYFGSANIGYKSKKIFLKYKLDVFDEQVINRGFPRAPYQENAFDDEYFTNRINQMITFEKDFLSKYRINVLAAYNYYKRIKNTWYTDLTTLNKTLASEIEQDTTLFNTWMSRGSFANKNDSVKCKYEIGYDFNSETGFGIRMLNKEQNISDYAVFVSAEYQPIKQLTVRPGLRYSYNTVYKAPLIPSINFKYDFNYKQYLNALRASIASGFRAPSLKELYLNFVDLNHDIHGNPALEAENSYNINVSYNNQIIEDKYSRKTDVSFFYNHINNMISLAMYDVNKYSYFNVDNFKSVGYAVNSEWDVHNFKIGIGCTYTGRYNQLSESEIVKLYSWSPEIRTNIGYVFPTSQLTASLFYKYNGKITGYAQDTDKQIYQTFIGDYHTADMSLSKPFFNKRMILVLGTKNLFDVRNISSNTSSGAHSASSGTASVGMGRTYFLKLDINLNKK